MERKRQLRFGAINITMPPPHRPERYVQLFQEAYKLEQTIKLQGDWVGLIGSLRLVDDGDGYPFFHGEFYKYINLDATRDWFNVRRGKPANDEELGAINIPDELKPHFQFLPFVFFPKRHRLVLVTKDRNDTLSSGQAAQILERLFSAKELLPTYGKLEIIVEPSRETLDRIFAMRRLRSLIIEISPPNPDDFEELEHEVFENMDEQQASSYKIELREADSRGLAPNKRTKQLAHVAQSNGKVVGVSGERGKIKTVSTKDHPLEERADYFPDLQLRTEVLLTTAQALLKRIFNNRPDNKEPAVR